MIVRHGKGILKQLERGLAVTVVIVYGNHIEAPLARTCDMAGKFTGDQSQFLLFGTVHSRFGRFYIASGSGFHFDKAEDVALPAHQIEFSAMVRRTIVASDDDVALAPEIEVGLFLAAAASALVGRSGVGGKGVTGEPVECAHNCVCEASAEHGSETRISLYRHATPREVTAITRVSVNFVAARGS